MSFFRAALVCLPLAATLAGSASLAETRKNAPAAPAGYRLVWSDEFDQDGRPDPAKWGYEEGFLRNTELQWYQPENASVSNGMLVIEARREHKPNPTYGDPKQREPFRDRKFINFTSASVTTKGLAAWKYGRIEVRARITAEAGLWPAIWTLGVAGKWPGKGEVDILEYYDHSILANFAWAERNPRTPHWQGRKLPLAQLTDDPDWDKQFHTWTMDWDAQQISLSVDGRLLNRLDLATVHNVPAVGIANPFRQPHYLILNLALGGQNGGPVRNTVFPSRYEIDYVRVYQREGQAG